MVAETNNSFSKKTAENHQLQVAGGNLSHVSQPRNAQAKSWQRDLERGIVRGLDAVAPSLAGKLAMKTWMRVPKRTSSKVGLTKFERATKFTVPTSSSLVQCYKWGDANAKSVLVCHGWEDSSAVSLNLVENLVAQGYCAVAMDAPGHGRSSGSLSSARRFAEAINEIYRVHGPFEAIVAHSIAGSSAVMALENAPDWQPRLVLISAMADPSLSIDGFCQFMGLSRASRQVLEEQIRIELGRPFHECGFAWTGSSRQAPILFIHDRSDKVATYDQAEKSLELFPNAFLCSTSGFGHRRIFTNRLVAKEVIDFIGNDNLESMPRNWDIPRTKM